VVWHVRVGNQTAIHDRWRQAPLTPRYDKQGWMHIHIIIVLQLTPYA
jgi:hypothetical protein